ncbi:hypothetical protein PMIN04_007343 [Paraphaeosphaeria minitans]
MFDSPRMSLTPRLCAAARLVRPSADLQALSCCLHEIRGTQEQITRKPDRRGMDEGDQIYAQTYVTSLSASCLQPNDPLHPTSGSTHLCNLPASLMSATERSSTPNIRQR